MSGATKPGDRVISRELPPLEEMRVPEKWPASAYPKFHESKNLRALRAFVSRVERGEQPDNGQLEVAAALVRYMLSMPGRPRMRPPGNRRGAIEQAELFLAADYYLDLVKNGVASMAAKDRACRRYGVKIRTLEAEIATMMG